MILDRMATGVLALGLTLLCGCATPQTKVQVPATLPLPAKPADSTDAMQVGGDNAAPVRRKLEQSKTPSFDQADSAVAGQNADQQLPPMRAAPVSINVQGVPVQVFANEVFGNLLGLTVSIDPAVAALAELVTLDTSKNLQPRELYLVARQVLADYGVAVNVEGKVVRVSMATAGVSAIPPLVVSGRALPQVPISHRPVFQLVELEVVRSGDGARWLTTIFGSELKVTEDAPRNALLISGKPGQVRQAMEALRVFDRPLMRGRTSIRLEPAFLSANDLADRLVEVLNLQGFAASRSFGTPSSVIVLPIQAVNSVMVFATTQEALDYTVSWARELDRASTSAGAKSMFYYQVRNTKASDLAIVLNGGVSAALSGPALNPTAPASAPSIGGISSLPTPAAPSAAAAQASTNLGQVIVDEPRNALIFQGEPAQWERTLTLIKQMDRAPRQVMIEVTIAEVSLDDNVDFGVSWFAKHGFGRFDGRVQSGKSGGRNVGAGDKGLTYLLDVAGQNRVALTAFANDNRVSILSTPRLLVKSGSDANIDIGTEVPIITMQTTSNQQTEGSTNLLQAVQYRKTGVILKIKPTIYSDDRIDLDVTQEVSEALPLTADSTAGSPSIFNRSLNTSLSLKDGGSVVMAGLISTRSTNSDGGIPLLKDVPLLGNLFKNKSIKKNKTELVLMIVPYIIESDDRAAMVSQAVIDRFELLDVTPSEPAAGPVPSTPSAKVRLPAPIKLPARGNALPVPRTP